VVAALINKFHKAKKEDSEVAIWGDGSAERELLYIDDAIEGILRTIMKIGSGFELLNIAHGKPTKIKELAEKNSIVFTAAEPGYELQRYFNNKNI